MDYLARAQAAGRRWREANGIPLESDFSSLSSLSSLSSHPPKTEPGSLLPLRGSRECDAKEAKKAKKESQASDQCGTVEAPCVPAVTLAPKTVAEALGSTPNPHDLASVTFEVLAGVAQAAAEIRVGTIATTPILVRGLPLGLWLDMDVIAYLLLAGRQWPGRTA
jgi:hypothetical protein